MKTFIFCRSRRKKEQEHEKAKARSRIRIRPCLSVCQTVEQKCPYLLPSDRAPSLTTQYAGEPTFLCLGKCHRQTIFTQTNSCHYQSSSHHVVPIFLFHCLDPSIGETAEQAERSNHGPDGCCYTYCNGPMDSLCTNCPLNAFINNSNESAVSLVPATTARPSSATAIAETPSPRNDPSANCPFINWTAPLQCILQYPVVPAVPIASHLSPGHNDHEHEQDRRLVTGSSSSTTITTTTTRTTSTGTSATTTPPSSVEPSSSAAVTLSRLWPLSSSSLLAAHTGNLSLFFVLLNFLIFKLVHNVYNIAWTTIQLQFTGL